MSQKKNEKSFSRMPSGVRNLDDLLCGGFPARTVTVLGGSPGAGKTTLAQQICFHNASPENKVLFFQTLSEPTAKTLRYLQQFNFFNRKKLENGSVEFVDLGGIMRSKGLSQASEKMMEHLKRVRPHIVVIDSFKVFADLAGTAEDLRKFSYEVAINLMAWECTGFLLGEFSPDELQKNPLSSIVDGIILMNTRETSGEQQRFIQVIKMRGTEHSRDAFPLVLNSEGIEIYAPRVTIKRNANADKVAKGGRKKTGIRSVDQLLGQGIPMGSSVMISGVAGTGKTLLSLEAIYRGAKDFNEKGIFFSFEETEERLLSAAYGLGWDLQKEIKRGAVEIVFIPQPEILVERDLLLLNDRIEKMQAKRVAIDSVSVFLHKVTDPLVAREKVYQLATLVQKVGAIGFFSTDIPYGTEQISRFGVEETVVDGIILLTSTENGFERERYFEVYKLRNTNHVKGRFLMSIEKGGITVKTRKEKTGKDKTRKGKKLRP
jgi:circadian clock protein KaiC